MYKCYVRLVGGLGNQLFQLACGYAYSQKYNKKLIINDHHWSAGQGIHPSHYKNTIFKNFTYGGIEEEHETYNESRFNYDEIPEFQKNVHLVGYFQSIKYFEKYKTKFIKLLNLPEIEYVPKPKEIAMHVRKGDFLYNSHIYDICSLKYFEKASEYFTEKYTINAFTDSKDWIIHHCNNFPLKLIIIQSNSELEDLVLMSKHNNIICSNSTFSWWGSLLGKKKEYIIVPNIWLKNIKDHDDIYRKEFTRIEI